jgi:hypothetical protein
VNSHKLTTALVAIIVAQMIGLTLLSLNALERGSTSPAKANLNESKAQRTALAQTKFKLHKVKKKKPVIKKVVIQAPTPVYVSASPPVKPKTRTSGGSGESEKGDD